MMYNLVAAVIGTGFMGEQHISALKDLVKKLIICSADKEKGERIAKENNAVFYTDYNSMLENEKIDVVHVCVPTPFHCKMTVAALNKGINVLCEKPFASSLDEAQQMLDAAENNGKKLMIGQCVRFSKSYEYLRRCINDKRFGRLMYLNSFRHGPIPDWSVGNWLKDASITGGAVRDLHIHDIDFIRNVLGLPKKVYSKNAPLICNSIFDYEDGTIASANCCWRNASEYVFNSGFDASFENATVTCKDDAVTLYTNRESKNPIDEEAFPEYFTDDAVETEIRYFYSCVSQDKEPTLCLARDCRDSFELSFKMVQSMESGEAVKL